MIELISVLIGTAEPWSINVAFILSQVTIALGFVINILLQLASYLVTSHSHSPDFIASPHIFKCMWKILGLVKADINMNVDMV